MKKLTIFLFMLASGLGSSFAQGLILDSVEFNKLPKAPTTNGSKDFGELPLKVDLTPHTPTLVAQGKDDQTCVAVSTALIAVATQRATAAGITDPQQILRRYALSPLYVFSKLNKDNCKVGLKLTDAANYLRDAGSISFSALEATTCNDDRIAAALRRNDELTRIREVQKVFLNKETDTDIEYAVKSQLAAKRPVVVGIPIDMGFSRLSNDNPYYTPSGSAAKILWHAVTVIGYDDEVNAFKLANSYGTKWGANGFFWMRYPEFVAYATEGLVMHLYPEKQPGEKESHVILGGKFDFKSVTSTPSGLRFNSEMARHLYGGHYELLKKDWKEGQRFQLIAENTQHGEHICVFSINEKNKINIHWPRDINYSDISYGLGESDLIGQSDKIVIPGSKTALRIMETGTDYLCILYGSNPIKPELQNILEKVQASSGTMLQRVQNALGSRLAKDHVDYISNKMEVFANPQQGDIIPIILEVNSK
ncbi:C1 family peptidase [Dyadobacter sp. CY261]|uniref:C1 family peptidase n=1 Tax=Dyadobacter sp. CY261 TaxID=2907203 RepID=UPI001F21B8A4|nr:C1 family peptidase [Dyadobacter sp. CY261]MCF0070804.1 C1 family peptidase [Dyadobacter sp. CY261]